MPSNVPTASAPTGDTCGLPPWKDEDAPAEDESNEEEWDDGSLTIREEANKFRSFLKIYEGHEVPNESFIMFKSLASAKFRDVAGIYSLRDLTCLDPDDIDEMIERFPKMVTMLIMDLLSELYFQDENKQSEKVKQSHVG